VEAADGGAADSAALPAVAAAVPDDSGYSSDSESDDEFDARLQRQRWQRRRHRRLASQDIARLDECTLGPNRRSVLPPTAVRLASRSREGSETGLADEAAAAATAAARGGDEHGGGGTAVAQKAQQADGSAGAAAAGAAKEPGVGKEAKQDGHKKGSSWWRRLYRNKGLQWSDYRIEQLPPGCKPVLVFVNTKSGPQVGTSLRQCFLRALHPLQVRHLAEHSCASL
jgi:diacylglycerol kinase (ATP)